MYPVKRKVNAPSLPMCSEHKLAKMRLKSSKDMLERHSKRLTEEQIKVHTDCIKECEKCLNK